MCVLGQAILHNGMTLKAFLLQMPVLYRFSKSGALYQLHYPNPA